MSRQMWTPRKLLMVLITWVVLAGAFEMTHGAEPERKTVTLIIDYGDGVEKRFTSLTATKDGTVLDILIAAQKHKRGVRFEFKGAGETGLLTTIDDLQNEGNGRNWTYRVNDKLADRSFAIFPVQGGDVVLWKFGAYR